MKINRNLIIIFILFIWIFLVGNVEFVEAQDANMPITVEPKYPDNHNNETVGYFDLNVNPGDQQSIEIIITNKEDKEIKVNLASAYAFTNPTGGIMYKELIDSSETILLDNGIHIKENIQVEESVTIPPQSSVTVPIEFSVPQSNGETLLGGVLISTQGNTIQQQQEVEEGTANFTVNTEMVIAMAIKLNLPNSVDSNFQLGEAGFNGELAQVYLEMINDAQKIQEEVSGSYSITNQEGQELFNGEFGSFKMAPKTKIRYPIQWGYETLEEGNYTLNIQSESLNLNEIKEFSIKDEDVVQFVEQSQTNVTVAKEEGGMPSWVWIAAVVLVGLLMFILGRRKVA
nr:DUF916 domain-containing protein [Lysinibacillus timonensis]